ncbi:hypothetical protein [Streptomyces sp. NPDC014734]|uniref:hypothetical protein n=1 Tax=Streptomyces sp. NPDC014734 TaxID=3364886 RepID=UPI0036F89E80
MLPLKEGYAPLAEAGDVDHQLSRDRALAGARHDASGHLGGVVAPEEAADLVGSVLQDAAGQVLVAAAHPR